MYGLPMFQIALCFFAFILHIIAISSSYWTYFYAKNEFGVPLESGHLGLWLVCYNEPGPMLRFNGGYGREFCDMVDTMFRTPPFLSLASVLAVVAALTILIYFPFAIMKQKQKNSPYSSSSSVTRYAGAFKLAIATVSAILTVLVMIFISVREQELGTRDLIPIYNFRGFWVTKGWAFYLEAIVALLLLLLAMLSLMENNRSGELDQPVDVIKQQAYPAPYNLQQAERQHPGGAQATTLPRRHTRNEYVDSPSNHNLRPPHSSQNSISGQADGFAQSAYSDRTNADDDIDQVDEDTVSPEDDLTKLNKHIRRSSRYPNAGKSPSIPKTVAQPLNQTANTGQPFSYHEPRSPSLNRNLAKSSGDIRPTRASSASRYPERRNSLERNERLKSPATTNIPISSYKSPSQRSYYDATSPQSGPYSPTTNYEFNGEPLRIDSPLLPTRTNQLTSADSQPQRLRTTIYSTETMTETTQSTTVKRPQDNILAGKTGSTIRYHNIDLLDPIDR